MIRFIDASATLPLRSLVLRSGLPLEKCQFDGDSDATTFHLGLFAEAGQLACILSCMKENHADLPHEAYRLRGLATAPDCRRRGYGATLMRAAMAHVSDQLGVDYLWLNARVDAIGFYEPMGFDFLSGVFDIEGAGPHRTMFRKL